MFIETTLLLCTGIMVCIVASTPYFHHSNHNICVEVKKICVRTINIVICYYHIYNVKIALIYCTRNNTIIVNITSLFICSFNTNTAVKRDASM